MSRDPGLRSVAVPVPQVVRLRKLASWLRTDVKGRNVSYGEVIEILLDHWDATHREAS